MQLVIFNVINFIIFQFQIFVIIKLKKKKRKCEIEDRDFKLSNLDENNNLFNTDDLFYYEVV
jgi:hypothetical protein